MKNKKIIRNISIILGIPILIILIVAMLNGLFQRDNFKYSEIIDKFKKHEVTEYNLNLGSGDLEIILKNGKGLRYTAPSVNLFYSDIKDHVEEYNKENLDKPMVYNLTKPVETSWLTNLFTFAIAPALLLWLFLWIIARKLSGSGDIGKQFGFGRAKFKNQSEKCKKTTFQDVAGADEEKEELTEVVEFLKSPKKFTDLGAKIPRGVLLIGPPGTGKTLLAKAVAGEAGVPFFSISGSEFVEMFVGVGASRVRDLFEHAKKNSPCIIFIDEIDAVGRQRGAGLSGGHDEREQTLNQLLVEMDGFETSENVIIISATNRPDILDTALTRPGRFDRQVVVGYPDIKGREEILRVHAKNKPFSPNVKLKTIAKSTAGFTGADLANLVNEAALLAARKNLKKITMTEVEESTIKVVIGAEKKSRIITDDERRLTAYHESGHAIATYFCETQDRVHQVSIIPRGLTGGYTLSLPEKDKFHVSRKKMLENILVCLGGRVAEYLVLGDMSTGASNDIEKATKTAKSMIVKYGMSDKLGPINYSMRDDESFIGEKSYSEKTAADIDSEMQKIIISSYRKVEQILKDNIDKLHKVAEFLLEKEKISGDEFEGIMRLD
ncbi:MAG: ATP-dependent zinc metalloprotease FtsH [Candidatus Paraimprobicoccus trichonymphae]|uniref:ATP-dependent zinc metalloprotease FtsH n=1 Tax=Candidatus Paraimprobicoccus trichonymphae TaxID=3033793 RepID=A0AA48KWA6_9FIRM|nr:MAG: ATP-dependent zinc metalloprotease FtsH [Candidatus Paraimprobicoccus trichonymphae]